MHSQLNDGIICQLQVVDAYKNLQKENEKLQVLCISYIIINITYNHTHRSIYNIGLHVLKMASYIFVKS